MSQFEKAEAIAKAILDLQQAVLNLGKIDSEEKVISLAILFEFFKSEMFKILATPIPKFPKGSPAIVNLTEKLENDWKELLDSQPKKKTWQERFEEMQEQRKKT